jgi:hypothetical protein
VTIGLDLTLVPINAVTGQARFGPGVAYALAAGELVDLALAARITLRGEGLVVQEHGTVGDELLDRALIRLGEQHHQPPTVSEWVADRGPWRIDEYVAALEDLGTLQLVPTDPPAQEGKRIEVKDPYRVQSAVDRLTRAIATDGWLPFEEQAFAALVEAAGCAWALKGRQYHADRKRLHSLRKAACRDQEHDAMARTILRQGIRAVRLHARYGNGSPRTLDEQIGLTETGRWAAYLYGGHGPL